jgi:hypothetical protein
MFLESPHSKPFDEQGRRATMKSGSRACPPGFEYRFCRTPPLVFPTSCSVGCVWGFWWFPPFELHVNSSIYYVGAEAKAQLGCSPSWVRGPILGTWAHPGYVVPSWERGPRSHLLIYQQLRNFHCAPPQLPLPGCNCGLPLLACGWFY